MYRKLLLGRLSQHPFPCISQQVWAKALRVINQISLGRIWRWSEGRPAGAMGPEIRHGAKCSEFYVCLVYERHCWGSWEPRNASGHSCQEAQLRPVLSSQRTGKGAAQETKPFSSPAGQSGPPTPASRGEERGKWRAGTSIPTWPQRVSQEGVGGDHYVHPRLLLPTHRCGWRCPLPLPKLCHRKSATTEGLSKIQSLIINTTSTLQNHHTCSWNILAKGAQSVSLMNLTTSVTVHSNGLLSRMSLSSSSCFTSCRDKGSRRSLYHCMVGGTLAKTATMGGCPPRVSHKTPGQTTRSLASPDFLSNSSGLPLGLQWFVCLWR